MTHTEGGAVGIRNISNLNENTVTGVDGLYPILPSPKTQTEMQGNFNLTGCDISVSGVTDYRVIRALVEIKELVQSKTKEFCKLSSVNNADKGIILKQKGDLNSEAYTLDITDDRIIIAGGDAKGCYYGICTLKQIIEDSGNLLSAVHIEDFPDYEYRGYYYDCSRGRIPTVDGLKKIIDFISKYKVNAFQIYIEHSFDFEEFKNTGRTDQDYLTAAEILQLDEYCFDHFIDFIPSLSTFGHLYGLLMLEKYKQFCELESFVPQKSFWHDRLAHHTIDPSNPGSFKVICSLIDEYLPLFKSNYFNICCDETFDLCKGRNVGKDKKKLYLDFVHKICSHVVSKDKKVMLWGDIILSYEDAIDYIDKDVTVLCWDYAKDPWLERIEIVRESGLRQIVCPGVSGWNGLLERPEISVDNITKLSEFGFENKAAGMMTTSWGDYGNAASFQCVLYGTTLGVCKAWNISSKADETFEKTISSKVYGVGENIIPTIREVGILQDNASWKTFFQWEMNRDKSLFNKTLPEIHESLKKCRNHLEKLQNIARDNKTLEHIIIAIRGVILLHEAEASILKDERIDNWEEIALTWFEEYKTLWLEDNKLSELNEIRNFILSVFN